MGHGQNIHVPLGFKTPIEILTSNRSGTPVVINDTTWSISRDKVFIPHSGDTRWVLTSNFPRPVEKHVFVGKKEPAIKEHVSFSGRIWNTLSRGDLEANDDLVLDSVSDPSLIFEILGVDCHLNPLTWRKDVNLKQITSEGVTYYTIAASSSRYWVEGLLVSPNHVRQLLQSHTLSIESAFVEPVVEVMVYVMDAVPTKVMLPYDAPDTSHEDQREIERYSHRQNRQQDRLELHNVTRCSNSGFDIDDMDIACSQPSPLKYVQFW